MPLRQFEDRKLRNRVASQASLDQVLDRDSERLRIYLLPVVLLD